jgi:hypothetical protein
MRFLVLLSLGLVACGGTVTADPQAAADAGADTAPIELPEPETGTPPTTSSCTKTLDGAGILLSGHFNAGCIVGGEDAGPPAVEFSARIVDVEETVITVDSCSPAADCIPMPTRIMVKAPGLDMTKLAARKNGFVKVSYSQSVSWGCTAAISIVSLDSWDGEKNPVDTGGRIYVAAGDGLAPTLPFSVERKQLHCLGSLKSCGALEPDYYAFDFGGATTVNMGDTQDFTAPDGRAYTARNLRSFYEGACDAYWDFAFWMTAR